jgi:methionine-rich copper-binding protein CopC
MKRTILSGIVACLFLSLTGSPASAHPPVIQSAGMGGNSQTITVTIRHRVNDPLSHFVQTILVYGPNHDVLARVEYGDQPSVSGGAYIVDLPRPVPRGVHLVVAARCNIFGEGRSPVRW